MVTAGAFFLPQRASYNSYGYHCKSSPFNCVKVLTMIFNVIKRIGIVNKNYFEFTLRGGHDSLEGKPGVVRRLASWRYIMPAGGSMSIRN
jgi:hypothetical protein